MNINTYEGFCSHLLVSRETYEKFTIFNNTLVKWQSSINLISNSTIENIWARHFLDSAQLYTFVNNVKGNILDFGSGAGFPGLILAIMGHKNVHLIESDNKKCAFLREVSMLTDVNVTIHNTRIEDLDFVNVDLITSRALAPLNKLIDYVEIFINKSKEETIRYPKLLFLKGKSYKEEVLEVSKKRNISYREFPSLTNNYGKILYIYNIDMINVNNEK